MTIWYWPSETLQGLGQPALECADAAYPSRKKMMLDGFFLPALLKKLYERGQLL